MNNNFLIHNKLNRYLYLSCQYSNRKIFKNLLKGINCFTHIKNNVLTFHIEGNKCEITLNFSKNFKINGSYNGVFINYKSNYLKGKIQHSDNLFLRCNNRFLALMISNQLPSIIINPLIGKSEKKVYPSQILYEIKDNKTIEFEILSKNAKEISFEIYAYTQKLVLDTTIEQERNDRNNVFSSVAFFKKNKYDDELLIRFNYIKMAEIIGKNIKNAYLYIKVLYKTKNLKLEMKEIENTWCSFATTWLNQPISKIDNIKFTFENNYLKVDITKYINSFSSKTDVNNPGFAIKIIKGSLVLVTADSYYYPNIVEVITEN